MGLGCHRESSLAGQPVLRRHGEGRWRSSPSARPFENLRVPSEVEGLGALSLSKRLDCFVAALSRHDREKKRRPPVDGRPSIRSVRDFWQGLIAGRGRTAIGAPVATKSSSSVVMPAAPMLTLVASVAALIASVTALVARLLTAGLAFALTMLVSVEITTPPPASAAAVIGAVLAGLSLAPGFRLGLGFWRFGGLAPKEFLHPAKQSARLLQFRGRGSGCRTALTQVAVRRSALWLKAWARLAEFPWAVLAAFPFRAVIGTISPAVFAIRTRSGGSALFGTAAFGVGLTSDVAERLALPTLFDPTRSFRRENVEFRFWRIFSDVCRLRHIRR